MLDVEDAINDDGNDDGGEEKTDTTNQTTTPYKFQLKSQLRHSHNLTSNHAKALRYRARFEVIQLFNSGDAEKGGMALH